MEELISTFIVGIILTLITAFIIYRIIKKKKNGSCCGCSSDNCDVKKNCNINFKEYIKDYKKIKCS